MKPDSLDSPPALGGVTVDVVPEEDPAVHRWWVNAFERYLDGSTLLDLILDRHSSREDGARPLERRQEPVEELVHAGRGLGRKHG